MIGSTIRSGTLFAAMLAISLLGVATLRARGEDLPNPERPQQVDLRTQLEKGLKARLPDEFAFINKVVTMVDAGTLSRVTVDRAFQYARKKNTRFCVFYFRRVLTILAEKDGVTIE